MNTENLAPILGGFRNILQGILRTKGKEEMDLLDLIKDLCMYKLEPKYYFALETVRQLRHAWAHNKKGPPILELREACTVFYQWAQELGSNSNFLAWIRLLGLTLDLNEALRVSNADKISFDENAKEFVPSWKSD